MSDPSPAWSAVLEAAARLQSLVPGAVLADDAAAAHHAGHRVSFDDEGLGRGPGGLPPRRRARARPVGRGGAVIHRHLDVPPGTPAEDLPSAAIVDLLERGDLDDWRPLLVAVARDPHGELARRIERLVRAYPMYGTTALWLGWIESRRARASGSR